MACQMHEDPTGIHKFLAPSGVKVTLCISSSSGLAKLTAARFDGDKIPVSDDACVTFTVASGKNLLFLTVISPDPNDHITVSEDCGDGSSDAIDDFDYDPNDPAVAYRIVGL